MVLSLEQKKRIQFNPVSIRNILTIRYDITEKYVTKPAKVEDFRKKVIDNDGRKTERLLANSYKDIENYEKFAISLSGGIDSTLCLAI